MERRVLLAVFLSFLVLVLYQRWVGPPPVPPAERQVRKVAAVSTADVEPQGDGSGAAKEAARTQAKKTRQGKGSRRSRSRGNRKQ